MKWSVPKVRQERGGGFGGTMNEERQALDQKYGDAATTVMLSQMLRDLPGNIADQSEKLFLSEALRCYRAGVPRNDRHGVEPRV
jgi:hypothetical protein